MSGLNSVYRHFNKEGELLYIGCTTNIANRCYQHALSAAWATEIHTIKVEHFPDRESAYAAEYEAIRTENPKWNAPRDIQKTQFLERRKARELENKKHRERCDEIFEHLYEYPEKKALGRQLEIPISKIREFIMYRNADKKTVDKLHAYFKGGK